MLQVYIFTINGIIKPSSVGDYKIVGFQDPNMQFKILVASTYDYEVRFQQTWNGIKQSEQLAIQPHSTTMVNPIFNIRGYLDIGFTIGIQRADKKFYEDTVNVIYLLDK